VETLGSWKRIIYWSNVCTRRTRRNRHKIKSILWLFRGKRIEWTH